MKSNKSPSPWPNQKAAVKAGTIFFRNPKNDRGQIIMACGTGKTEVGIWLAEKLKTRHTLVLVPSLALVAQTMERWNSFGHNRTNKLIVCSQIDFEPSKDGVLIEREDLLQPPTTDSLEIRKFLIKHRDDKVVVFCTYHSSPLIGTAQFRLHHEFDLVISDEAHRIASSEDSAFATVLDAKKIKAKRRLFMTATSKIYSEHAYTKAEKAGIDLASMDDIKLFGPEIYRYSFAQAIKDKRIADYKIVVIDVTEAELTKLIDKNTPVRTDAGFTADARDLAAAVATLKSATTYEFKHAFAFLSSIARSQNYTVLIQQVARRLSKKLNLTHVSSEHMDGTMSTRHRDETLMYFKARSGFNLISNCQCLGEGVDAPSVESVIFADPKQSVISIVQAVGRALRCDGRKDKIAYIIVPLLIPSKKRKVDASKMRIAFIHMVSVINAMKMHDERLSAEINELRKTVKDRLSDADDRDIKLPSHLIIPITSIRKLEEQLNIRLLDEVVKNRVRTPQEWLQFAELLSKRYGNRHPSTITAELLWDMMKDQI